IVHQARQVAKPLKRLQLSPLRDVGSFRHILRLGRLQQGDAFLKMSFGLAQRIVGSCSARRFEQVLRRAPDMPGLAMLLCQPFWLTSNDFGKASLDDVSDMSMELTTPVLRKRLIGGLLNERMTKHIARRRRQTGAIEQLIVC